MFNLGDKVWYVNVEHSQFYLQCPDCFGNKYLTVILGDSSQVTIDCTTCSSGYHSPIGKITSYDFISKVREIIIDNIEILSDKIIYGFDGGYRVDDDKIFFTKKEAGEEAKELILKYKEEELKRLQKKEKPRHSWAWQVTYHRGRIKSGEKELEYHKSKLNVALSKRRGYKQGLLFHP